jgi:8-oxo-dGTP pyrophosphatase MutT (NUDIX family)
MPMSDYLLRIRQRVGHDLLVLPSAAIVLRDNDGRVLFGLHADKNIWVTPGGLIEPGELPADAVVREAWEETGLIVDVTEVLGVYGGEDLVIHYANGDVASYVGTIFRGRVTGGELRPDGVEILDLKYYSRAEIEKVPHAKWISSAMDAIFSTAGKATFQPSTWRPS